MMEGKNLLHKLTFDLHTCTQVLNAGMHNQSINIMYFYLKQATPEPAWIGLWYSLESLSLNADSPDKASVNPHWRSSVNPH